MAKSLSQMNAGERGSTPRLGDGFAGEYGRPTADSIPPMYARTVGEVKTTAIPTLS